MSVQYVSVCKVRGMAERQTYVSKILLQEVVQLSGIFHSGRTTTDDDLHSNNGAVSKSLSVAARENPLTKDSNRSISDCGWPAKLAASMQSMMRVRIFSASQTSLRKQACSLTPLMPKVWFSAPTA